MVRNVSGFDLLFEVGRRFAEGEVLEVRDAGTLSVRTGHLLICDPADGETAELLAGAVPLGTHRAAVSITRRTSGASTVETIAALKVAFSREPAVRWEAAHFAGIDPAKLPEGGVSQAVIESNTLCVLDASQKPMLDEKLWDTILADLATFREAGWQMAAVALAGGGGIAVSPAHTLAGVLSYWGLDASGRRAALVVHIDDAVGREEIDAKALREATRKRALAKPG